MAIDERSLAEAIAAREELERAQDRVETARREFNHAVRRMHIAGGSLREIADALGLSHQRVHQIVDEGRAAPAEVVSEQHSLLRCSFCGKTQKRLRKLIAGPGVCVCDECLSQVHLTVLSQPNDKRVTLVQGSKSNCSFCGKKRNKVAWIAEGVREPLARICNDCVALCDAIIDDDAEYRS